jgi:hypothetical protein
MTLNVKCSLQVFGAIKLELIRKRKKCGMHGVNKIDCNFAAGRSEENRLSRRLENNNKLILEKSIARI